MTGIERLRRLAGAQNKENAWTAMLANELNDIADQIERERACDADTIENIRLIVGGVIDEMERHVLGHEGMEDSPVARWARELREALGGDVRDPADDVSMSAYDLLPEEEREAIAWVRKYGGLEKVKLDAACWNTAENIAQTTLDWLARVCSVAGIEKCGYGIALERLEDAISSRLMPEGMEWLVEAWPRFKDDAPVRFLDDFERYGEESGVSAVTMYADGSFALNFRAYSRGERVNRPAPKVLDADGVEIRVGDVLYRKSDGHMVKVAEVHEKTFTDADDYVRPGDGFTHRAPVLAADGRPLREGETVYGVNTGYEYTVTGFNPTTDEDGDPCVMVVCKTESDRRVDIPSNCLTHERPVVDTWERLEEDATVSPEAYCAKRGIDFSDVDGQHRVLDEVTERMARDLVRRARALAGRDAS